MRNSQSPIPNPQPPAPSPQPPTPSARVLGALGIIGVVICVSFLEGTWVWFLAAAIAEVAGQAHPSVALMGLVLGVAWLAARITEIVQLPLERRRWLLVGGGITLALVMGTVQAGLLLPVQLVVGYYTPDYRGAGIVLLLLAAYLWGRGLWLAMRVNRERVIGHIGISASALAAVLLLLPLSDVVQGLGLAVVTVSFLFAIAGLLLAQLEDVEFRQLTPLQWISAGAGAIIAVVLAGLMLTGALTSGLLSVITRPLVGVARFASPVVDAVLMAAGYLAQYLSYLFRWLGEIFGGDPEAVRRGAQQAEAERPLIDPNVTPAAPEIFTAIVAVSLTLLCTAIAVTIFYRLVARIWDKDAQDVIELRSAEDGGPGAALRGLLDRFFHRDGEEPGADGDPREAIRRQYRAFQVLMARANLPRGASQTPHEYRQSLAVAVPPADPHVGEVTDAYVVARYAPAEAPLADPEAIRRAVARIRENLRDMD